VTIVIIYGYVLYWLVGFVLNINGNDLFVYIWLWMSLEFDRYGFSSENVHFWLEECQLWFKLNLLQFLLLFLFIILF